MRIEFVDKGIVGGISDAMKEYAHKRLNLESVGVESIKLTIKSYPYNIEVKAVIEDKNNKHYYITTTKKDFYWCIDVLQDRIFDAVTTNNREINDYYEANTMKKNTNSKIVKEKVLIANQISEDEAIKQMEELGHNFFIFRNDDDNVAVLYRRFDGDYGLIEVR